MLISKMVPRLPIDSCEALFDKLKWERQQLENDWTSSYTTFNFVVTAYHLYRDWIKRAGTNEQKLRLQTLPAQGKLLFDVWRDITNATKHWELNDRSQSLQVVNDITGPIIGDWDSFLFTGPVFYVRVGAALPSLPELASATIGCFTWILEDGTNSQLALLEETLEMVFRPLSESQEQELISDVNGT
jgi:hypothetical protein